MRPTGVVISVVIPTLNEQTQIGRALECTRVPGVERIVVDANSSDGTAQTARFLRAEKVIQALPGRARQMDAGYREASGAVVLFLHADTRLDPGWDEAVLGARVPVVLTSRADNVRMRIGSTAVAKLMAHGRRAANPKVIV